MAPTSGRAMAKAHGIVGSVDDEPTWRAYAGQELRRGGDVGYVAGGQQEGDRPSHRIGQGVNLRRALAARFPKRVGWIHAKRHRLWRLPEDTAWPMLFLGSRRIFSFGMGLQALGHGIFVLYFETPFGWSRVPTLNVVTHRLLRFVLFKLLTNRLFGRVQTLPGIGWVWRSLQPVISRLSDRRFGAAIDNLVGYDGAPLLSRDEFVPGRVLLVNSALAWGGTERQLVNTALGLVGKGARDVTILCENSDEPTIKTWNGSKSKGFTSPADPIGPSPATRSTQSLFRKNPITWTAAGASHFRPRFDCSSMSNRCLSHAARTWGPATTLPSRTASA